MILSTSLASHLQLYYHSRVQCFNCSNLSFTFMFFSNSSETDQIRRCESVCVTVYTSKCNHQKTYLELKLIHHYRIKQIKIKGMVNLCCILTISFLI